MAACSERVVTVCIQTCTRSTVESLGDAPFLSLFTNLAFPAASAPNLVSPIPVTSRNASTSRRKVGPIGVSSMKSRTRSAVSSVTDCTWFRRDTNPESPTACTPNSVAFILDRLM